MPAVTPNPPYASERQRALVLLSGGLDSSILLHYLALEKGLHVHAVQFNFGQTNWVAERPAAQRAVAVLENGMIDVIDLTAWRAPWHAHVSVGSIPRNATLALLAVPLARMHRCSIIAVGSTIEDAQMPDGQPDFYAALNAVLERSEAPERVSAVWLEEHMRKSDFVKWALMQPHLGESFVRDTRSCWKPEDADRACGTCPACRARSRAFEESGLGPDQKQ